MNRRTFLKSVPALAVLAGRASSLAQEVATMPAGVADLKPIPLLKPERDGGKSVLAALWDRKTNRNISDQALPPQVLSNLLWAGFGVNRETGPSGHVGRTAASARNVQEIDLYVAMADGVYLYEAVSHRLVPVVAGDLRVRLGRRRGATPVQAPVSIIYVADVARYGSDRPAAGAKESDMQKSFYNIAAGLIAGNVYLFAASQGLAAWFHTCDAAALAAELKLRPDQRVLYVHRVGYPA